MRGTVLAAVLGLMAVGAGTADAAPVGAKEARDMLFKPSGMVFYPVEPQGLDAEAMTKVAALQEGMGGQMAAFEMSGYGYYGAFAVPKGQALTTESLAVLAGMHSPAAAQAAVLEMCKETNDAECTVIGLTLPKDYEKRDLMLSAAATKGVLDSFGDGDGPRYLAYSPSTAGYAVVKGNGADAVAIDTCNEATNGRDDCVIGIVEE